MTGARITKEEKLALAITLRDAALILVEGAGTWEAGSTIKLLSARVGTLLIAYRTPFQRMPVAGADVKYRAAALGLPSPPNLLYGLDVWCPKKVMCVEWDDQGAMALVSLRRGEWEADLTAAAAGGWARRGQ